MTSAPLRCAWLIERANMPAGRPLYLEFVDRAADPTGQDIDGWAWTIDHDAAAQFERREDGEKFWRCVLHRDPAEVAVVEHGWC